MADDKRIYGTERDKDFFARAEIQDKLIGDHSSGDGAYLGQDHGLLDLMISEIIRELIRVDHLLVAFIVFGLGGLLVGMDPLMLVFFQADMDMEIDDFHVSRCIHSCLYP